MKFVRQLGVDLGTANIIVWEVGVGIVVNQPAVVAIGIDDRRVLAAGEEAKLMVGKNPEYIEIVEPVVGGVIVDFESTVAMIKYFISQIVGKNWFIGLEIMAAVPSGVSQVEQRAVYDAFMACGARKVYLIDAPLAAAIGAKIPVADSFGNMIVGVGGGITEAAVISLGGVVSNRYTKIGSSAIDEAISEYVKKKFDLNIGKQTAETIKIKLGSAIKMKKIEKMEISGRDYFRALPKTIEIDSDGVYEAILPVLLSMLEVIKQVVEATPPELVADIVDRGIVLIGGGAQLKGLSVLVTREIGVSCHIAIDPALCVVKGTANALENIEAYRRALK